MKKKALILVDIQNDFLPGGALAVKDGDQIIPVVNDLLLEKWDLIVASKDWHPKEHGSFAKVQGKEPGEVIDLDGIQQILWPTHCVQESFGSEFSSKLDVSAIQKIFYKGDNVLVDSYSVFFDNGKRKSTGLECYLKEKEIEELYFVGLATDYCVKFSVLDSLDLGFTTYVIKQACRGVNIQEQDSENAFLQMKQAGALLIG